MKIKKNNLLTNMYPCCVWRVPIIHAFTFIFPILPCCLCRGATGHVERTWVVVVVAHSRGHGPDPRCLWHAGNRGPGRRVTDWSRIWRHCSQVEGQVLGGGVLQSCLHHVLGVMFLELVSSFSTKLQWDGLEFTIKTFGSNPNIYMLKWVFCLSFKVMNMTRKWPPFNDNFFYVQATVSQSQLDRKSLTGQVVIVYNGYRKQTYIIVGNCWRDLQWMVEGCGTVRGPGNTNALLFPPELHPAVLEPGLDLSK